MATRKTKAELLALIAQLESEMGVKDARIEVLQTEVNAYLVAQRPSRTIRTSQDFAPTVNTVPVVTQAQRASVSAWRERAAAAKALAMRCGTVVRL